MINNLSFESQLCTCRRAEFSQQVQNYNWWDDLIKIRTERFSQMFVKICERMRRLWNMLLNNFLYRHIHTICLPNILRVFPVVYGGELVLSHNIQHWTKFISWVVCCLLYGMTFMVFQCIWNQQAESMVCISSCLHIIYSVSDFIFLQTNITRLYFNSLGPRCLGM